MTGPELVDARALAGEPDGFQRLWTPHRMAYIGGENKPVDDAAGPGCPFCRIPSLPDDEGLVVARGTRAYVVMNLYPYNPGHVLVCPYRHVADYTDLSVDEVAEVGALTQSAMRVLRAVLAPSGFNLGMNQGDVAGAGIAAHLHQHVVPRWDGDSNFLPVVGRSRALPELLSDTRARLAAAWPTPTGG
ncbi:MAG: HIT domain-containing protein [Cellulomonas sp.]|uniref:HIT family protein n=1 Tax=Cellulomonas TaxID=1707 RepID=UPI0006528009|nr:MULTISPECIES: HIT domain-containing protein [Cellulomonas]KMM45365.1 HIT family hydrolase [Cellulomonas sp. A375-1]MCR6647565.1 HIT domain-containing protein [Cellulomonas sp.]MCR6703555.1 HIT domain-containing protein [Cellulomonas sp.]